MPQLDLAQFAPQIFWLFVLFGLFYIVMSKMALPRISDVLAERQRQRENDLEKARQFHEKASDAVKAYEASLAKARADAMEMKKQAQDDVAREIQKKSDELSEKIAKQITEGEARIAEAKTAAIASVTGIASEAASAMVEKLAGFNVDQAQINDALAAHTEEKH
jgi:F-type H+-transporting ATPase subunit b